jgi:Tol biopolymer transport system component
MTAADGFFPRATLAVTSSLPQTQTAIPKPSQNHRKSDPTEDEILFLKAEGCTVVSVSASSGVSRVVVDIKDCGSAFLSPDGRYIAYIATSDPSAVYLADIYGSGQLLLGRIPPLDGETPEHGMRLAWSPDGGRLAVETDFPYLTGYGDLYLIPSDGRGEFRRIFLAPLESNVQWSPDGNWLFYFGMISANGNEPDNLPMAHRINDSHYNIVDYSPEDSISWSGHFEWSPDSGSLSLISKVPPADEPEGKYQFKQQAIIVSALTEGRETVQSYIPLPPVDLPEEEFEGWDNRIGIRWSPDGNLFLAVQRLSRSLAILQGDGSLRNIVLSFPDDPLDVDWSPDGGWIYFVLPGSGEEYGGDLGIVRPDGSDMHILAEGVAADSIVWAE